MSRLENKSMPLDRTCTYIPAGVDILRSLRGRGSSKRRSPSFEQGIGIALRLERLKSEKHGLHTSVSR